jgi:hypothetical protein
MGSLLGLLSYPFIFEPRLGLKVQSWLWSVLYLVFVGLYSYAGMRWSFKSSTNRTERKSEPEGKKPPSMMQKLGWVVLPACASILLLAVTNQLTQEIAVIPFLWVLPLGIYLVSFMVTFSGEQFYSQLPLIVMLAIGTLSMGYRMNLLTSTGIFIQILIFSFFLLCATLVCHGELYRLRPEPRYLTSFYLYIALGGAIGGAIVNLVAPLIFQGYWELHIGVLLCWLLVIILQFVRRPSIFESRWRGEIIPILLLLLGLSTYLFIQQIGRSMGDVVDIQRNFYGVTRVQMIKLGQPPALAYKLKHGSTLHGLQFIETEKRPIPTAYYGNESGAGLTLIYYSGSIGTEVVPQRRKIGVIGLGVGTLAIYGKRDDQIRFYEINPDIIDLALGEGGYFSYLNDSLADIKTIPGDARISLETEYRNGDDQEFDILIVDAFSSDSIPIHLLTQEAFDLYLEHLKPQGVLALHTSNRYLDLSPLVRSLAESHQLESVLIRNKQDDNTGSAAATWILLSKNPAFFEIPEIHKNSIPLPENDSEILVWTDDYSNLLPLIKKNVWDTIE